jgi:hypothetical protein
VWSRGCLGEARTMERMCVLRTYRVGSRDCHLEVNRIRMNTPLSSSVLSFPYVAFHVPRKIMMPRNTNLSVFRSINRLGQHHNTVKDRLNVFFSHLTIDYNYKQAVSMTKKWYRRPANDVERFGKLEFSWQRRDGLAYKVGAT